MSFIVVSKPFNDTDGFKTLWIILLVIFGEVVFIWLWWEVAFFFPVVTEWANVTKLAVGAPPPPLSP